MNWLWFYFGIGLGFSIHGVSIEKTSGSKLPRGMDILLTSFAIMFVMIFWPAFIFAAVAGAKDA
jgi:hypothetical protein